MSCYGSTLVCKFIHFNSYLHILILIISKPVVFYKYIQTIMTILTEFLLFCFLPSSWICYLCVMYCLISILCLLMWMFYFLHSLWFPVLSCLVLSCFVPFALFLSVLSHFDWLSRYVCLSFCLFLCVSITHVVFLTVCLSCLFLCVSITHVVFLSVCLFLCLSVFHVVCLFVGLSLLTTQRQE